MNLSSLLRTLRAAPWLAAALFCSAAASPANAQSGGNYRIESGVFNSGGNPAPVLSSASFKVTLDSIGDTVAATGLTSPSYTSGAGFSQTYLPPREILGDTFTDKNTLVWLPDPSVGSYDVYKGTVGSIAPGFGTCLASGLTSAQLALNPADIPAPGTCFFYLVTARNLLGEEGTKGYQSTGSERSNPSPCP